MKKSEFVKTVAAQCGMTQTKAEATIAVVFDTIKKAVNDGDEVAVRNFGIFKLKSVAERNGTNPQTGKPMVIQAHKVASFKPSENFFNAE